MSTFVSGTPQQGHAALSDLTTIRNDLVALRDLEESLASAPPANPVSNQFWKTSDTKTTYQRNQANDTWIYLWSETDPPAKTSDLNNHIALNITNAVAVHGVKQGSGNGFDADKLDGYHASAFAASGHTHTGFMSGLDADLLDYQHGSYYLARGNHTGTQPISTLSDHTKANHDALGIVPGAATVGQGQLKTSVPTALSGSIGGGGRVEIATSDYAFMPNIYTNAQNNPSYIMGAVNDVNNSVGRFCIKNDGPNTMSYTIRWRCITASEGKKIIKFVDGTGVVRAKLYHEDAPPDWQAACDSMAQANDWTWEEITKAEYDTITFE